MKNVTTTRTLLATATLALALLALPAVAETPENHAPSGSAKALHAQAMAQTSQDKMDAMHAHAMENAEEKAEAMAKLAMADAGHDHAKMMAAEGADVIEASGVVLAIHADKSRINLHHEPIPALDWPAMKMPFSVKDADLLDGLTVGDRVYFTLDGAGASQTITSLTVLE